MYQVGISSFEESRAPACPEMDQISDEAAKFLNREDLDNFPEISVNAERSPIMDPPLPSHKNLMVLAAGLFGVFTLSYFALSGTDKVEQAAIEKPASDKKPEKPLAHDMSKDPLVEVLTRAGQSDPELDTMVTGSIADPTPVQVQRIHIIKSGDTLSAIAQKYGTSVAEIVEQNAIENPNRLKLNTKLLIR